MGYLRTSVVIPVAATLLAAVGSSQVPSSQSYEAHLEKARDLFAQVFHWQEALNECQAAIQQDPSRWEAYVCAAKSFTMLRQFDTALKDLQAADARAPVEAKPKIRAAIQEIQEWADDAAITGEWVENTHMDGTFVDQAHEHFQGQDSTSFQIVAAGKGFRGQWLEKAVLTTASGQVQTHERQAVFGIRRDGAQLSGTSETARVRAGEGTEISVPWHEATGTTVECKLTWTIFLKCEVVWSVSTSGNSGRFSDKSDLQKK